MRLGDLAHGRDNNFQLIRFLSATAVIVFHCYALTGRLALEPVALLLGNESTGSIGVKSFFVVSGFLVTRSFIERGSLRAFLAARVLRIYPALIVATLFSVAVAAWSSAIALPAFLADPLTHRYVLGNGLGWRTEFVLPGAFPDNPFPHGVNGSLWTIPIEIRMYLFCAAFGVLGLLNRRFSFNVALAALIAFFAWQPELLPIEPANEYARGFAMNFAAGAFACVHRDRIALHPGAAALAVALMAWNPGGVGTGPLMVPLLAYALLVLAYHPQMRFSAFNRLGDYSYGLYLYAFPIQQALVLLNRDITPWRLFALALPLTLAVAALSWHGVEKPALGLKSRFRSAAESISA